MLELMRGRLGGIPRKLEVLEELSDIQRSSAVAQTQACFPDVEITDYM